MDPRIDTISVLVEQRNHIARVAKGDYELPKLDYGAGAPTQ